MIKLFIMADGEYTQKRSFYVSDTGISFVCMLKEQECMAVGTNDHHITMFSFSTGTKMHSFQAHDNTISGVCVYSDSLISISHDTTIKIWNMTRIEASQSIIQPVTIYDHEEAILSLDVCQG